MRKCARIVASLVVGMLGLCVAATPASAFTQTVTSLADDGSVGTLRYAINNAASGDTIIFGVTGTITLTQGRLNVDGNLNITGPGSSTLILNGNFQDQVFYIAPGATVSISGVTITNGNTSNVGGGVLVDAGGNLTLSNSVVTQNTGAWGGGIFSVGQLTVNNSTVSNNLANSEFGGGGIYSGGQLTVNGSTISANTATGPYGGGGVMFWTGNVTISNSTISGNSAPNTTGGGIAMGDYPGTLTMTNTTIASNTSGYGGGLFRWYGSVIGSNVTIWNNTGTAYGGGFYNGPGGGSITLKGSLLGNNITGSDCFSTGTLVSLGYNFSDDGSCGFSATGDVNGTPAGFDPAGLKNNGGSTQTVGLSTGSAAIDAIPPSACTDASGDPLKTDQRGIARPQGQGCDLGAFEASPLGTPSTIASNFNGTAISAGSTVWFNSVLKVSGMQSTPVTITVTNATITFVANGINYKVPVPNSTITFSPTAGAATTVFDVSTNSWHTTVPSSIGGNVFLDGAGFLVGNGLPGGISPVSWSANFSSDTPGVTLNWQWAAAVYSSFGADNNSVGVKSVDSTTASTYQNSDHAGTPENYKGYLVSGGRGGGGSNYTGGYSGSTSLKF